MTQTLDRDSVVVAGPWGPLRSLGADPCVVGIVAAGELLADPATVGSPPVEPTAAFEASAFEPSVVERSAGEPSDGESPVIGALAVEACILRFVPAAEEAARRAGLGRVAASGRRPVRLTRRGRIVVLAALIVLAGAIAAFAALPSQAADPATPARVVVVQPGDSLWTIAERYRPGADPVRAVDELIRVNDLPGTTIYAGEELTLPSKW